MKNNEFDVILVGSGTCGATIARELVRQNKKVLLLEQGDSKPLKETLKGIGAIAREIVVGKGLKATTAVTAGGATGIYFSVCKLPTAATYEKIGIDFSRELAEVLEELPVAELPDQFLPPQAIRVRDSAQQLGYPFKKNLMLVDQSRCAGGHYAYEAKWKARSYVEEAVNGGATLLTRATVTRVLVENGRAIGVEYKTSQGFRSTLNTAYGKKIVLSAGALVTPQLLMGCGVKGIGNRGFFIKPGFMVCGTVPALAGRDAFIGCLDTDLGNGISIGDGTMNASLFKLLMLANFKWKHLFAHSRTLSVGVLMSDGMGGEMQAGGRYHKQLSAEQMAGLKSAEQVAIRILKNAGAEGIFSTKLAAGIPGGALRVNEHLDQDLQTQIRDLFVCDHTLIADE
jgi:hypothetical protein